MCVRMYGRARVYAVCVRGVCNSHASVVCGALWYGGTTVHVPVMHLTPPASVER